MIYYVFEIQSGDTGAALVNIYTNIDDAYEKYYEILKFACKSDIRKHGAVIINEDGYLVEAAKVFEHPALTAE